MPNALPEKTEKLLSILLTQLATVLQVELSPERVSLYSHALKDLTRGQLQYGVDQALKLFTPEYGRTFPSPAEIREWAESYRPEEPISTRKFQSVADMDPDRCPKGWTPEQVFRAHLTLEHYRREAQRPLPDDDGPLPGIAELGKHLGVTPEEIEEWKERGKERQAEYIAKLEADPKWQEMAKRLGTFPGLPGKRIESEIPKDPEARKAWATKKAKEQGWL